MKKYFPFRWLIPVLLMAGLNPVNAQTTKYNVLKNTKVGPSLAGTVTTAKMTRFVPSTHGYKFFNNFTTPIDFAGINGLELRGLCGGMAYSALDYFNKGIPIPSQDYMPANRTPLQSYIYNRQINSLERNVDKWTELIINPFGWRTSEFFNWGIQGTNGGRIQELREMIDKGSPVPLGLFKGGSGGISTAHHQVVAIGYDMGRYKGDLGEYKEDFKLFIYDPNHPNAIVTLRPRVSNLCYSYDEYPTEAWLTYFVDKKYTMANPPRISSVSQADDNIVRELIVMFTTGGDDLRGGNDNVSATVNYTDGTSTTHPNLNRSARWIGSNSETVSIPLTKAAPLNQIKSLTLKTSFGGGFNGDNWNLNSLLINARVGTQERSVYSGTGNPLVRFDGNNRPFEATFTY